MSTHDDSDDCIGRMMELNAEFLGLIIDGLKHQAEHGATIVKIANTGVFAIADMCPDSIVLLCGSNVAEAIAALRTEASINLRGIDEAAAEIERLKKGRGRT